MRIPTNKIYRAFPELDRFTDDQCERLIRRVRLHGAAQSNIFGATTIGALAGLVFAAGVNLALVPIALATWAPQLTLNHDEWRLLPQLLLLGLTPTLAGLASRDAALRRQLVKAITIRLERVRCPACQYILIGQQPRDGAVTCPECGVRTALRAIGITEQDLIPPTIDGDVLDRA